MINIEIIESCESKLGRILVIEDDLALLGLLRVHLAGAGYRVDTAAEAVSALRSIVAEPPDLILLDLNVPYLDSFELLAALRAEPATDKIPVIVLTGRTDDDSYARAKQLGVQKYFTKPVAREELLNAIEAQLAAGDSTPAG